MRKPQNDLSSRVNEMHYFNVGAKVIESLDNYKTVRTVVSVGGLFKDDHIQLDDKNSPWMIAGHYERA